MNRHSLWEILGETPGQGRLVGGVLGFATALMILAGTGVARYLWGTMPSFLESWGIVGFILQVIIADIPPFFLLLAIARVIVMVARKDSEWAKRWGIEQQPKGSFWHKERGSWRLAFRFIAGNNNRRALVGLFLMVYAIAGAFAYPGEPLLVGAGRSAANSVQHSQLRSLVDTLYYSKGHAKRIQEKKDQEAREKQKEEVPTQPLVPAPTWFWFWSALAHLFAAPLYFVASLREEVATLRKMMKGAWDKHHERTREATAAAASAAAKAHAEAYAAAQKGRKKGKQIPPPPPPAITIPHPSQWRWRDIFLAILAGDEILEVAEAIRKRFIPKSNQ